MISEAILQTDWRQVLMNRLSFFVITHILSEREGKLLGDFKKAASWQL